MELWIHPGDLCAFEGATSADRELAAHAASEFMWAATGRQFGQGTETVRPCRSSQGDAYMFSLIRGSRGCGCSSPDSCSCRALSWVRLPRDYVTEILSVTVDGVLLEVTDYRLVGRNRLYRTGGSWPCCQRLDLDTTEVGTWEVEYQHGRPVPKMGLLGAQRLACELAKMMANDATCRLPSNVRSVNRQGITVELMRFYEEQSSTGLFEVDMAIRAMNPNGQRQRSTAWSPELHGKAVRERISGS